MKAGKPVKKASRVKKNKEQEQKTGNRSNKISLRIQTDQEYGETEFCSDDYVDHKLHVILKNVAKLQLRLSLLRKTLKDREFNKAPFR